MNDHRHTRKMLTLERDIEGQGFELCSTFNNLI